MTNKINKLAFYGRPVFAVAIKSRSLYLSDLFADRSEKIAEVLAVLDNKTHVSNMLVERITSHLVSQLLIPRDAAETMVAQWFGWGSWKGMLRSKHGDEQHHVDRAKANQSILNQAQGDMRTQAQQMRRMNKHHQENRLSVAQRKLNVGTLSHNEKGTLKTYFFHRELSHLHLIEKLLEDYTDFFLEQAIDNYPEVMGWMEYHKSFGVFWREVSRLHTSGKADFSEPGLTYVKKLCHYLFSWNFRRYLSGEIILRYARFLPRSYRKDHVAARRDNIHTKQAVIVDIDYPEHDIEEDTDVLDTTPHHVAGE